ncbi:hypothetical protein DID88_009249 [Monilinia fructigena]|uniref:Zn(2)-C6 fungal-type domain-containing protein n=1 Tax=Monilinia fructigena TaxID=38457 RepID=A0A395IHP9_9HELO|nr:hypothetical protein DID88_009249 [Monilinia fructigena]
MSGPPNLRTLLPNSTDATLRDSSTSTSNNQKITPDTSSAPSISAVRTDKRSEKSSHITKKRRIPSSITANACGNCKKARSKCDGQHPCGRCAGKGFRLEECIYEPHTKNAKRTLVRDLKESHRIKRSAEKIFECLVSNTENEHEILERIKNKESIQSIAEWLDSIDSNGESQLSTYAGSDHETVGGQLKGRFLDNMGPDDLQDGTSFHPRLQPTQDAEEVTRWEEEVDKLRWKQYRFPLDLKGGSDVAACTLTTYIVCYNGSSASPSDDGYGRTVYREIGLGPCARWSQPYR